MSRSWDLLYNPSKTGSGIRVESLQTPKWRRGGALTDLVKSQRFAAGLKVKRENEIHRMITELSQRLAAANS